MIRQRSLSAGAARVDITPTDLTGLNPMGRDFTAVHDPIYVRALVVGDGVRRRAVISADLIEVGDTTEVRARIERESGIPAEGILIAPTHSHNAPRIGLVPPGGKARRPSAESLAYTESVYGAMVEAVRAASAGAQPAQLAIADSTVDVNINREEYRDGRWVHGYNPEGPSDKALTVVTLAAMDGALIAVLLNYAVHSTVTLGTGLLSGDLAGAAQSELEQRLDGAVALWTSGALGDQAPRVSLDELAEPSEAERTWAHAAARAQGIVVAGEALRILRRARPAPKPVAVGGGLMVIPSPVRRLEVPPGMEQAQVDNVDLTLTLVTLGPVALAGVSGEVTVPVYRALRQEAPLARTLVVSNANARIGYLPSDDAFARSTPAAEGCPIPSGHVESAIVSGMVELIADALADIRPIEKQEEGAVSETSRAEVVTDRPARYGKQLVSHLSRRHGGEWDDERETGRIDLGSGSHASVVAGAGRLSIAVSGPAEEIPRLERVVAQHLERFATRDEITVAWVRDH